MAVSARREEATRVSRPAADSGWHPMFIPISTDTTIRRTPWTNYALLGVNVLIFVVEVLFGDTGGERTALGRLIDQGVVDASAPRLHEFFTYQFLHADVMHLAGNMLFLWVFGNPVNAKMGDLCYFLFYLSGGVFAGAGYAWFNDSRMIGASGAIASVTTAYLALFPRSHITVVYWWFLFGTFELPSMIMIVFKIIIWDNIIAMTIMSPGGYVQVAYSAHLMGYGYGLAAVALLLGLHWLPRDQFDIVALWRRWWRRQGLPSLPGEQVSETRVRLPRVARPVSVSDVQTEDAQRPRPVPDRVTQLRTQITEALGEHARERAARLYEELMELDPRQILPRSQQVEIANQLYLMKRLPQAVAAYEKYLVQYPNTEDRSQIRLLLGITYARDLHQHEPAESHLRAALDELADGKRIEQCRHWLGVACEALGKPFPQG